MRTHIAARLTYANVMATLAFFLAAGGGAFAAFKLPNNSVGTKQLKKGAVTGAKLRAGAVGASKLGALPAVRVANSTSELTSSGLFTAVSFETEQYDNARMHSTSVNTTRLTATVSGVYDISGQVAWEGNAVGDRELLILKNGGPFVGRSTVTVTSTAALDQQVSAQVNLRAGDYVELLARQSSGGTINLVAEDNEPVFAMHWLGP